MNPDTYPTYYVADPDGDATDSKGHRYRRRTEREREEFQRSIRQNKEAINRIAKESSKTEDANPFRTRQHELEARTKSALASPHDMGEARRPARVMRSLADKRDAEIAKAKRQADRTTDPTYQRVLESSAALTRSASVLYPHLTDAKLISEALGISQSDLPISELSRRYWAVVERIEEDNLAGERAETTTKTIESNRVAMEASQAELRLAQREQAQREAHEQSN
jgi:hypothetical protein